VLALAGGLSLVLANGLVAGEAVGDAVVHGHVSKEALGRVSREVRTDEVDTKPQTVNKIVHSDCCT